MKKCIVFLLLIINSVLAQSNYSISQDSLENELSNAKNDTSKVLILEKLTGFYAIKKPTLALRYGRAAWNLADSIRFNKGKILSAISSSEIMASTSDNTEALNKLLEAKFLCEKQKYQPLLIDIYLNLSITYAYQNKFSEAFSYLEKAKQVQQKHHTSTNEILLNLTFGRVYRNMNKLESSLIFTKKAYKTALNENKINDLAAITFYLGDTFWQLNQIDSTKNYFRKSLSYQAPFNEGRVFYGLALVFKQNNQADSAIFYAKKALAHSHEYKYFVTAINSAKILIELNEKRGNLKEAIAYYKISTADKDSLTNREKIRQTEKFAFDEKQREFVMQKRMAFHQEELARTINIYALTGLLIIALIIAFSLYRNNRVKHKANDLLQQQKEEIDIQRHKAETALNELKITQAQLIQSEKLASLGELTAGIAHEIQNPLNFVNNFSELSVELIQELSDEIKAPIGGLGAELLADITQNIEKINLHGKRASSIVKGMLEHSRTSSGKKELTDINALADEYLKLSYHGLRAKDSNFNATLETHFDENLPKIAVIPQDIGRVLINLINNAFYVVSQRNTVETGHALSLQTQYQPTVTLSTQKSDNQIIIKVKDNGAGMSEATKAKIFQPFFTTKPTGQGTGLGLSLAYDIITKGHGGTIECESVEGEGTTFIIKLPIQIIKKK